MPHDEQIGAHRIQGARRIPERLALLHRRLLDGKCQNVRAETRRSRREGHERTGRILVEEVEDELAGETLVVAARIRAIVIEPGHARIQQTVDLRVVEVVDRDQVHECLA